MKCLLTASVLMIVAGCASPLPPKGIPPGAALLTSGKAEAKIFNWDGKRYLATRGEIIGWRDGGSVNAKFVIAYRVALSSIPDENGEQYNPPLDQGPVEPLPASDVLQATTQATIEDQETENTASAAAVPTTSSALGPGVLYVPRNILVLLSGQRGGAQNEQVITSAESTKYAIVPHRTDSNKAYIVLFEHGASRTPLNIEARNGGAKTQLISNSAVEVTYGPPPAEIATFERPVAQGSYQGEMLKAWEAAVKLETLPWTFP